MRGILPPPYLNYPPPFPPSALCVAFRRLAVLQKSDIFPLNQRHVLGIGRDCYAID